MNAGPVSQRSADENEKQRTHPLSPRALSTVLLVILVAAIVVSMLIGAKPLPVATVWQALTAFDGSQDHLIVTSLRGGRTVLAVLCGAGFAVAGALVQAFTRNPLADPGILGVNAGAAFAVTLGVAFLGVRSVAAYLPLAAIGAILTTIAVWMIAARGRGGPTPLRMTLVGIAVAAVLSGMTSAIALLNEDTFNRMRYWGAGTVADRPTGTFAIVVAPILIGLLIAASCAPALNSMALGDDLARGLGVNLAWLRLCCIAAITLLCGAGTAAVGPIGFVGLVVPHIIRWLTGTDQRRIILNSLLGGPVILLLADIIGRLIVWPSELQAGIITAFIGAPVLIVLVRATRASTL